MTVHACRRIAPLVPTCIVACAETTRSLHIGLGYPSAKMIEIPNGFDLDQFKPDLAARERFRSEVGIADDQILVGIIGRFVPLKNHRLFVESAAIAASKHPGLRFAMIGDGLSADNAKLVSWIRATSDPQRFQLLGRRSDTPGVLNGLDIIVQSSDTEAFPLVLGEGMATGTPVVATNVGDTARLVGDTGEIVPPGHAGEMADAILRIAELGPEQRAELGVRARARIADNFDIELISDRYEQLWRRLAAGQKPCD